MSRQTGQKSTAAAEIEPNAQVGRSPSPYFLEGADRVLRLLDAFTAEAPELRLTDLGERLGIPKSQALRIASTLEHGNYLIRDPETKRYRLGMRLFSLGMLVERTLDLKRIAQPTMDELAAATEETVGLFVIDRDGPICVDVRESPKGLRVFAQVGRRMPWNAGASGKLALAFLPEFERESILDAGDFHRFTDRTVVDPDRLREETARIKAQGYHVGVGDLSENAIGIAAPIYSHSGRLAGTLSLSAPYDRAPEAVQPKLIDLVSAAAAAVSRQLGFDSTAVSDGDDRAFP
jgi:DNA-binding IclR family transcriptional regulator